MQFIDSARRPRNPNIFMRNMFVLGLLTFGMLACTPQTSGAPNQIEQPNVVQPSLVPPTQEIPVIITTQQNVPTLTPIEPTQTNVPISIFNGDPTEWATGETEADLLHRMSTIMFDTIAKQNQYEAAQMTLPQDYLNAVVSLEYETDPAHPWGGTATFIGFNPTTNESIYITDSHVMLSDSTPFHIKKPETNTDIRITSEQITISRAPEGLYGDLAIVKLSFIPNGIGTFSVTGNSLCDQTQPQAYTVVNGFSFPYLNKSEGGNGFTPFFSTGTIEEIGGNPNTLPTTCWIEPSTGYLGIPTTIPTRPGSSGTLLLNDAHEAVGLTRAVSPHGAVVTPLNQEILNTMIAQSGFVFP